MQPMAPVQVAPQPPPPPVHHAPLQHARLAPPHHVKYNRRNNPELEKRRVHHCDFIGNTNIKYHTLIIFPTSIVFRLD